jgi:hypothetical protein
MLFMQHLHISLQVPPFKTVSQILQDLCHLQNKCCQCPTPSGGMLLYELAVSIP